MERSVGGHPRDLGRGQEESWTSAAKAIDGSSAEAWTSGDVRGYRVPSLTLFFNLTTGAGGGAAAAVVLLIEWKSGKAAPRSASGC